MAETIQLLPYQDKFLFSDKKFPCLCGGVGSGKTKMLLLKAWSHAEMHPGSTGLIVRNEFTDLRDSTVKDFKRYFNVDIDSNKEYKFKNGSVLLFRHGSELNTLKNMSLSFVGIEQAEEFQDDEQFTMLRDRLRHPKGTRQLCIICNANGHNWIWKLWKNNPPSEEYHLITATSFDNPNLPADFIADLRRMEVEQPNHYAQYVMNCFEQMEDDDFVFNFADLMAAKIIEYAPRVGYGHRLMGYDVARYGNDMSAAVGIHQLGALAWKVFHVEQWGQKDLDATTGRIRSTSITHRVNNSIIDEDGIGSGPLDFITQGQKREDFRGFRNKALSMGDNPDFANTRTVAAFKAKEYINKGWLAIPQEELIQELMTLRYRYTNDGRRILVSKEDMRKKGVKSPNMADAFLYACSLINEVKENQDYQYKPRFSQRESDNLFAIAGVR
jgi:hypothetical protein